MNSSSDVDNVTIAYFFDDHEIAHDPSLNTYPEVFSMYLAIKQTTYEGSHARCSAHWNCHPPDMKSLILGDKLGA
ncbi:hypothetical protein MTR_7g072610 [Medicago truncatula]|uniref:Uncharacterized protein n=1 Tax=Medicago truncatula TaxID=3880 RepID=A0A072U0Q6_MEDTR|nr:hypothetical protein MTR_7g072610 [Medicago truncatula]